MESPKSYYDDPLSVMAGPLEPNQAVQPQGKRPRRKYARVEVLLLSWADDNLGVREELDKLEKLLSSEFNFTTDSWRIPSDDAEDALTQKILSFRKGKYSDDLLILYYGGHAGGDSQECIWAANNSENSPVLNWHNIQSLLLGSAASVLIILDCCFATLGARNYGKGDNWFLGASVKESETTGVSRDSFTSALTRELERYAHRYWKFREEFTVQSIHSGLMFYDRDLEFTPSLVRLTNHDCDPTSLTPLSRPPARPLLQTVNTEPLHKTSPQAISSSLPLKSLPIHATLPSSSLKFPENSTISIELSPDETQTVRLTDLPLSTKNFDIIHWFSDRVGHDSLITRIGPIVKVAQSMTTTVTFASVAIAKRALAIPSNDFAYKNGGSLHSITIDKHFQGLTSIYSSTKSPNKQPTVDVIFVHGSGGHAINSFACHYIEPSGEVLWPRDKLPNLLEQEGIFPRIMTYGWNADAWVNPPQTINQLCDPFLKAIKDERLSDSLRPAVLIGHGVGGFLVKQAVTEIINMGFSEENFENPVKSCFFFAVPHRKLDQENGFAPILASMKSAINGAQVDPNSIRRLKARNTAISNLSREFEDIRREYSIPSISFNEERETGDLVIVPKDLAILDQSTGKAYGINENYCNMAKLPAATPNLISVLDAITVSIAESLGIKKEPQHKLGDVENVPQPRDAAFSASPHAITEHQKEKVYARLQRYDTVFLVDDSSSMYGIRWKITSEVLASIASIAVIYDKDGVDLRFFNNYLSDEERLHLDSSEKVMKLFKTVQPDGPTLTADVLEEELSNYFFEYTQNRHKKGLNLIVLTDGEPEPGQNVENVIVKYAKDLEGVRAPPLHVGVQFVQIGGDEVASRFLKGLDDDLKAKHGLDRDVSFLTR